jgi:subtilisin family serine protease
MKKLLTGIAAFLLFGNLGAQNAHPDYLDGAIWVKLQDSQNEKLQSAIHIRDGEQKSFSVRDLPFANALSKYNVTSVQKPFNHIKEQGLNKIVRIEIEDIYAVEDLMQQLEKSNFVEYVERVPLLRKTLTPNDPNYNTSSQWALFQIDAGLAWDYSIGNANVTVAIVDDAVSTTHSDLAPVIWNNSAEVPNNGVDDDNNGYIDDVNGWDAADSDNNPNPPANNWDHGTHVAGIAGAATDNGNGIASIGHNLSIIPVKATNSNNFVTHGYEGVAYAVSAGADVINMSWGSPGISPTGQSIITYASNQGVILIAAAGNDNVSSMFYPAGFSEVMAVASTTFGDSKSGFSNFGSWIDISAPGSAIYSTVPNGGYQTKQGTSMASPLVAGLAGLMLSYNPGMGQQDVLDCITSTATNIDAANPSYIGQLGAGRINAEAAMACVQASLSNPPTANFNGTPLTILEGNSVDFNDLSTNNPTTWNWTFNGGTPATFSGQNPPPIVYNTAGTYDVTLQVSSANGTDTETISDYVVVNALTGCDTITNTLSTDQNFIVSYANSSGYLGGTNNLGIDAWADKYSAFGPTSVTGAYIYFVIGETNQTNTFVTVNVWEANGAGNPGAVVYTEDIPMTVIEDNVTGPGGGQFFITNVSFDQPANVSTNDFFVGYTINNGVPGDSISCAMTENFTGTPRPNTCYARLNGVWDSYEDLTAGASKYSMQIYPRISQTPPVAIINPSATEVCEGEFITFDGSSSPNTVVWEWAINGSSNPTPTGSTPQVLMNADGTHMVYMLAQNSCGFFHIDSTEVTVNPSPDMTITSTADTICPGGSVDLAASGANSYAWTPGGSLSCTNCPNPTANPSTSTTYSVIGSIGLCDAQALYEVVVDDIQPDADFIISSDTICVTQGATFNGAVTDGASIFDWTINGGSPASGSSSVVSSVFNAVGTYQITLSASNSCGLEDEITKELVVVSLADCPTANLEEKELSASIFFNANEGLLNVDLTELKGEGNLMITSSTGQIVYKDKALFGNYEYIDLNHLSHGVYMVIVENNGQNIMRRFAK